MEGDANTPYAVLGLPEDVDMKGLRNRFLKLSRQHHPDKPDGNRDVFEVIYEAYQSILSRLMNKHRVVLRDMPVVEAHVVDLDGTVVAMIECIRCGELIEIEEGDEGDLVDMKVRFEPGSASSMINTKLIIECPSCSISHTVNCKI